MRDFRRESGKSWFRILSFPRHPSVERALSAASDAVVAGALIGGLTGWVAEAFPRAGKKSSVEDLCYDCEGGHEEQETDDDVGAQLEIFARGIGGADLLPDRW